MYFTPRYSGMLYFHVSKLLNKIKPLLFTKTCYVTAGKTRSFGRNKRDVMSLFKDRPIGSIQIRWYFWRQFCDQKKSSPNLIVFSLINSN